MQITVSGSGYVGLVTAVCLAEAGNHIMCLDVDDSKIDSLKKGVPHIYEAGLEELLVKNISQNRISFTTDKEKAIKYGDVHFIAVGTPENHDGSSNLDFVKNVANNIGSIVDKQVIVVNKSTVPVGTADLVSNIITDALLERKKKFSCPVVSNPEFLKEGAAINDFMKPDRIILGSNDKNALNILKEIYSPFNRNHDKVIEMDARSAEFTKYASNSMLAARISLMNEFANLAENLGADIEEVRIGIGSDSRIGYDFLYPGCGYGGSCFPKDVNSLIYEAENKAGVNLSILKSVQEVNEAQKLILVKKIRNRFGDDLSGLTFAIWGLSFKPNTDDMRSAPSIKIINELLNRGAKVVAHDPMAIPTARSIFGNLSNLSYEENYLQATKDADALVIITEWQQFRSPDFKFLSDNLKNRVIFDGRNIYDNENSSLSRFEYHSIGRLL